MTQDQYNSILMHQFDTISYICDIEAHEFLYMTPGCMKLFGFTDESQYRGKHCHAFLLEGDNPCAFCSDERLVEGKQCRRELYKKSQDRWFELTDTLTVIDGRKCRLGTVREITSTKREQIYLSEKLSLDSMLIDCLNALTKEKDLNNAMFMFLAIIGGYYMATRTYIFEFDPEKHQFQNTFRWCLPGVSADINRLQELPPEAVDAWMNKLQSSGGFSFNSENSTLSKDSPEYQYLADMGVKRQIIVPLMSDNKLVGFLGVDNPGKNADELMLLFVAAEFAMGELDKRRLTIELEDALDKANSANRAKSTFLFNMSHDIRTPMNAILGFSSMAEKYIDDKERVLDSLKKLNTAGEHLQRLITDVLDMSRLESGKDMLHVEAYRLPSMISDTRELYAIEMQKKNIHFDVSCDVQDEIVFIDRLRFEQIELNLLSNAIKYTAEGGHVSYTISQVGPVQDGYAVYQGVVKDNGIGMSDEFKERLFGAFEREKTVTIDGIQGTGLGLAITKALITRMDGQISCQSEQGKGTAFTFTIPLKVGEPSDVGEDDEPIDAEDDFTGKRILLVEDNELNREIAADILMEFGLEIEIAEDGAIAVDMVSNAAPGHYDLILMDIQMPNLDGYGATRAIRKLEDPALANIPIVAMTANVFEEDRQNAFAAGMNEHLPKPIDIEKLLETLTRFLLRK